MPISDANEPGVGSDPAGAIDDPRAFDDAREGRAQRRRKRRHDATHRLGVRGLDGSKLRRRERARCLGKAADRDPLDLAPVDETAPRRPLRPAPDDGRGRAKGRPDQEPGLPDPVVTPRQVPLVAPALPAVFRASTHPAATPRSTGSTSGKSAPNNRLARSWNRAGSPVVSCRCVAAPGVAGASRPLTLRSSASAEAVAVAESTIATPSPTWAAITARSSG